MFFFKDIGVEELPHAFNVQMPTRSGRALTAFNVQMPTKIDNYVYCSFGFGAKDRVSEAKTEERRSFHMASMFRSPQKTLKRFTVSIEASNQSVAQ